ncbi:endolytic transglycosylase MltG [Arsenicitalea aurantiaca]|uniref:Endolytic murein transglycosylase n=1 Tax=Arsenicitalea aurantiaca TaxID=1783274 RepID=A0A433X390_9HYPH|nr:endolytic transglycosylase MltG [Arsenicitalea aurantiaca]RUT28533.1 endolytic transglycosylase MltG [Arsenicitalea aurantiaca]
MNDRQQKREKKPRRRRNGFLEILNALLTLIVIGMLLAGGAVLFGAQQFYSASSVAEDTSFTVERGSGLNMVAQRLQDQGIISNRYIFQLGSLALRRQGDLKAGEFRIPAGASMSDILRELTEGSPIQYAVTIPEGFTSWQVVERLNADSNLVGEIASLPAEGTILPQTYNYDRNNTRASVLEKMQEAHAAALADIWESRDPDLPIETPEELVILASIIEKETGVADERRQVASVFVNRLRRGMRLQSDPTIIYGITQGQGTLGRGLRRSEIDERTPYNTYQIDRLPPTPIANPGIESLRAAANPDETEYLYFVADGTGGHAFARTYAEHRQNVANWRRIEAERASAAEQESNAARDAVEAAEAAEAGEDVPAEVLEDAAP